jgi:hypothetical protein
MSVPPPGAKPTTMRTGRVGHFAHMPNGHGRYRQANVLNGQKRAVAAFSISSRKRFGTSLPRLKGTERLPSVSNGEITTFPLPRRGMVKWEGASRCLCATLFCRRTAAPLVLEQGAPHEAGHWRTRKHPSSALPSAKRYNALVPRALALGVVVNGAWGAIEPNGAGRHGRFRRNLPPSQT